MFILIFNCDGFPNVVFLIISLLTYFRISFFVLTFLFLLFSYILLSSRVVVSILSWVRCICFYHFFLFLHVMCFLYVLVSLLLLSISCTLSNFFLLSGTFSTPPGLVINFSLLNFDFCCHCTHYILIFQLYLSFFKFFLGVSSHAVFDDLKRQKPFKRSKSSKSGWPTIWTIDRNCHASRSVLLCFCPTKTLLFWIGSSRVIKSGSSATTEAV